MPITSKTAPIYKLGIALESKYEFNTLEKGSSLPLTLIKEKGSSLPLTLINAVLYFPCLFFNFPVVFYKLRNSSVIKVFVSYCLSWVKGRLDPFSLPQTAIATIGIDLWQI